MSFGVFVAVIAMILIAIEGVMYYKTKNNLYLYLGVMVFVFNLPNFLCLVL